MDDLAERCGATTLTTAMAELQGYSARLIKRLLASLPGYFFSTSETGLYVHLYDNCELKTLAGIIMFRVPDPHDGHCHKIEKYPLSPSFMEVIGTLDECHHQNITRQSQDYTE